MKWRCTWCGKPHAENDPPCDTCGHGEFEEAVVRDREFETVDTGTQYEWICSNCGRQHVKNTPPCSRCGNYDLEKTEIGYADLDDVDVPSWFEVAKPYAPFVVALVVVVGLFVTGVVPLSVLPGVGVDVPGEDAEAAGIDLETTAVVVHDRLEDERAAADQSTRTYDEGLAEYVTTENQRLVASNYGDGGSVGPTDPSDFDTGCDDRPRGVLLQPFDDPITTYEDETELADDISAALLDSEFGENVETGFDREGIDVHVGPDGQVFVGYAACR